LDRLYRKQAAERFPGDTSLQNRSLTLANETQAGKHVDPRLRHSDEIFRLLVESVKDYAIFLLDPEGRVATWNEGAERIKGYKADEIIGEHFSRFYPTEARESKWPERELQIATREGRFVDEGLRVRKDGSTFWAYVVITALRDSSGELRGFSKVTRDLTERRTLEERTQQLNRELRRRVLELTETQRQVELRTLELQKLSGELLRVQDEERRRLARTLHDELGQELVAIKLELQSVDVLQSVDFMQSAAALERAIALADSALQKVRSMSYLLHPPLLEESGLLPALHWYFEGLQSRGQVRITFEYRPLPFPRVEREIETTVFRVIQESLTNVYRHSQSQDARVELIHESDIITIRVRDFGIGMPENKLDSPATMGVGISGMRERVKQLKGDLRISRAEPGTLVQATIPTFEPI
jgi:PAS domain S-box-containing protein